jgi:type II secretion system protein N
MNRQRILLYAGYNAFFWFAFWLFAYWTFPYDRLAAYLVDKVAESGTGYTIEIGSLAPYWFTGVQLEDVKVRKQASEILAAPSDPKAPAALDQAIRVQSAHARLGLFALLFGSNELDFGASLGQGEVEGSYEEDGASKQLSANLSKVDLAKLGVLESLVALPMKGTLTGDFDLTLGAQPAKTSGKVKLTIQKLTIGDGKAKLKVGSMGGLTIDPIAAGDVTVELDVQEGLGTIRKLSANGTDLRMQGSGDVRFADPLARSRINVLLRLELTPAYRNKSPRTRAMFALLEGSNVPQVSGAKTADGAYQLRLSGTLASARALPAGGREQPSGTSFAPPPPPPGTQPGDEDE